MMNIQSFAVRSLVFVALLGCVRFALGADRRDRIIPASALRPTMEGSVSTTPIAADFRSMPKSITNVRPHPAAGGIAGTIPGTNVYSNEIDGAGTFYAPGAGDRMADDLILAGGGCDIVYYNLGVFSPAMTADPPIVPTVPIM